MFVETVCVAIVGKDDDAGEVLALGFNLFPSEKTIMLTYGGSEANAKRVAEGLPKPMKAETRALSETSFEGVFKAVSEIKADNPGKRIVLNTDTDYRTSCIALSAAFVNGIQAIGVLDERIVAYPIMKFSYYSALSDKKIMLLKLIAQNGGVKSLEELSGKSGMSLPLIIYHLRGSREKIGLDELGLVECSRKSGSVGVKLTPLGRLIVNGHVGLDSEGKPDRGHAVALNKQAIKPTRRI